jgi:hypothetical protein
MWEILRRPGIDLWLEKSSWIRERHGLVNVIVHPDYLMSEERLALYYRFLEWLAGCADGWHALPCEVARWWRARETMHVRGDGASVTGADGWNATVARAREEDGRVVYDTSSGAVGGLPPLRPRAERSAAL